MYTHEFQEYKRVVTEAYRQRQAAEPHLDWLVRPTRARIKQRCLELCTHGVENRDEEVLHHYLKMAPGDRDFETAFNRKDAEDFKTLEKFFDNTGINTAEKNIEILAWLIEYPHRPFKNFKSMMKSEGLPVEGKSGNTSTPKPPEVSMTVPQPPAPSGASNSPTTQLPVKLLSVLTLLLAGGLLVWSSFNRDECMYWAGDRYAASPCSAPKADTPLVAMDRSRLKGFYRIKKTDTLTRYAVKRFWYARVADTIEVYSAGGRHPLSPEIKLKEVTDYIVNVCNNQK